MRQKSVNTINYLAHHANEMVIPFHTPTIINGQDKYLHTLLENPDLYRERKYATQCIQLLKQETSRSVWLTKSCTQALELAAQLLHLDEGDEVIMPSYGFVSTANAFAQQGARCMFVDVRPDTMNIDEQLIESVITEKTKAIVTINYAGVACNYNVINAIAKKYRLPVIEDNAHGILAKYQGRFLGSFGDIATNSFDHLKNLSCGEGGAITFNNSKFEEEVKVRYEFGTNKIDFLAGKVSSYEWRGYGSNHHISEFLAAMLLVQLENATHIIACFKERWNQYKALLTPLAEMNHISLPVLPADTEHNAHLFYIFTKHKNERAQLIDFLNKRGIATTFHYTPLHSSEFGRQHGIFSGEDVYTTRLSDTLLRLPLFYSLTEAQANYVVRGIYDFYEVEFHL